MAHFGSRLKITEHSSGGALCWLSWFVLALRHDTLMPLNRSMFAVRTSSSVRTWRTLPSLSFSRNTPSITGFYRLNIQHAPKPKTKEPDERRKARTMETVVWTSGPWTRPRTTACVGKGNQSLARRKRTAAETKTSIRQLAFLGSFLACLGLIHGRKRCALLPCSDRFADLWLLSWLQQPLHWLVYLGARVPLVLRGRKWDKSVALSSALLPWGRTGRD